VPHHAAPKGLTMKIRFHTPFYITFIRPIKHWYQRITRGFSDEITWNLDGEISKWILPRLKRFKELNNGHPNCFTWEEWNIVLDKMILAHELHSTRFEWIYEDEKQAEINHNKIKEGMYLFNKYYGDLWW
jgi:hypothetical protein